MITIGSFWPKGGLLVSLRSTIYHVICLSVCLSVSDSITLELLLSFGRNIVYIHICWSNIETKFAESFLEPIGYGWSSRKGVFLGEVRIVRSKLSKNPIRYLNRRLLLHYYYNPIRFFCQDLLGPIHTGRFEL